MITDEGTIALDMYRGIEKDASFLGFGKKTLRQRLAKSLKKVRKGAQKSWKNFKKHPGRSMMAAGKAVAPYGAAAGVGAAGGYYAAKH